LDQEGKTLVHRKLPCDRELLLKTLKPYREDLAVAVECLFCWYWVADLCSEQGITFVLGHALYMKAIHGGKTKNDRIDSYKIAALLRGGNLPYAYVYPRQMRATRDLLRRRLFFARKRGELLTHIQNTNTQYNLPALEERADKTKDRGAIIEHFDDETVQMSIASDIAMLESEVTPVLQALRKNGLDVVAIHHHMTNDRPVIIFLHYWGTGSAEKLAAGFKAAVAELGRHPAPSSSR
jgi:transposase